MLQHLCGATCCAVLQHLALQRDAPCCTCGRTVRSAANHRVIPAVPNPARSAASPIGTRARTRARTSAHARCMNATSSAVLGILGASPVPRVSPVPVQMWARVSKVPVQMWAAVRMRSGAFRAYSGCEGTVAFDRASRVTPPAASRSRRCGCTHSRQQSLWRCQLVSQPMERSGGQGRGVKGGKGRESTAVAAACRAECSAFRAAAAPGAP